MLSAQVISFLEDLKRNNNRDWFQANKHLYESSMKQIENFVNRMIPAIGSFDKNIHDLTAKDCMFRIYRDVRFSKDKMPYKTNIGAYISRGGRKGPYAGYYLHIEPDASFLAGGVYMPLPPVLKAIRKEIYFHSDEFKNIINEVVFRKLFGRLDDSDKLKKPPQGFDLDFEDIELLKYKSYIMMHSIPDELVTSERYFNYVLEVFEAMLPLNSFLNRAIETP